MMSLSTLISQRAFQVRVLVGLTCLLLFFVAFIVGVVKVSASSETFFAISIEKETSFDMPAWMIQSVGGWKFKSGEGPVCTIGCYTTKNPLLVPSINETMANPSSNFSDQYFVFNSDNSLPQQDLSKDDSCGRVQCTVPALPDIDDEMQITVFDQGFESASGKSKFEMPEDEDDLVSGQFWVRFNYGEGGWIQWEKRVYDFQSGSDQIGYKLGGFSAGPEGNGSTGFQLVPNSLYVETYKETTIDSFNSFSFIGHLGGFAAILYIIFVVVVGVTDLLMPAWKVELDQSYEKL